MIIFCFIIILLVVCNKIKLNKKEETPINKNIFLFIYQYIKLNLMKGNMNNTMSTILELSHC